MPNNITNFIQLIGNSEDIKKLVDEYSTLHIPEIRRSFQGNIIYKTSHTGNVGWLNEETKEFSYRNSDNKTVISDSGILPGYEIFMSDGFTRFPDFEKVILTPNNDAYHDNPDQESVRHDPDNWYNWNIKNWGTKWNGYVNLKHDDSTFTFETAWSGVPSILEVMAKNHPNVILNYMYADEDIGSNVGLMQFEGPKFRNIEISNNSNEAFEIGFILSPDSKEYYHKNSDDNWEYNEDLYDKSIKCLSVLESVADNMDVIKTLFNRINNEI